jgi:hypothetical protein
LNQTTTPSQSRRAGRARLGLGVVVALAIVAGIVVWLVTRSSGNSSSSTKSNAVAISPGGLRTLAGTLRQPIYWVGPQPNVTYELTRPVSGRILLGYLTPGLSVGTKTPHLIIGTYSIGSAYAVTQKAANKPTTVPIKVAGSGAIAFWDKRFPLSSFVAYPGSNYQIEVYAPTPGASRKLVASGKVNPVPGSPSERTRPVAVTPRSLKRLAAAAHHPIYWAGPLPGQTYEMTRTTQGWFYIRYLPPGIGVGVVGKAYLTVGTYPVTSALAAVKRLARASGASSIRLPGGGLGAINPRKFPNSVFLAYPGANYQIEVFDPSLAHARQLVVSGKIVAVH